MHWKLLGTMLIPGGMLTAAHADTWVMRDTLRPNGRERPMAAKHADAGKCGAVRGGRSFNDAAAPNMQQCMLAHGWVLDHVVPDAPSRHARRSNDDHSPPVDYSPNDDWVRRQQDQDNLQQMLNAQQMINNQQMQNDQMFQQQQQQMINDMNNP
jgi:hypothetical protein